MTNISFRFIDLTELKEALDLAGFKVPGWRVRDMIDKYDREPGNQCIGQRKLSYGEFEHVSRKREIKFIFSISESSFAVS